MVTVGEGEVGVNRESSTDIYTLPHVTEIASGKLRWQRELSLVPHDHLEGWEEGWAGNSRGRGHKYILYCTIYYCTAETNQWKETIGKQLSSKEKKIP